MILHVFVCHRCFLQTLLTCLWILFDGFYAHVFFRELGFASLELCFMFQLSSCSIQASRQALRFLLGNRCGDWFWSQALGDLQSAALLVLRLYQWTTDVPMVTVRPHPNWGAHGLKAEHLNGKAGPKNSFQKNTFGSVSKIWVLHKHSLSESSFLTYNLEGCCPVLLTPFKLAEELGNQFLFSRKVV